MAPRTICKATRLLTAAVNDPGERFSFGHPNDALSPRQLTAVSAKAQVLGAIEVPNVFGQNEHKPFAINVRHYKCCSAHPGLPNRASITIRTSAASWTC